MPEIAEVARVVHHIRKHLVGKTISAVNALDDGNIFGKVGTTAAEFQKAMTGKKVIGAGQQGKYFWIVMSSPPHPVIHLGMTGWLHIRGDGKAHYRPSIRSEEETEVWPPKFWKFTLEMDSTPKVEAAFTDARRFGRVRLLDCAGEDLRKMTPLKENGPDPVIDSEVLTEEWLEKKMKSKHVPVKALLLDQANISGIGNWVGDEVLYNAKLHPEQYSDTFSSEQLKQLHKSIMYVCQTAVDLLADSSKFPDDWLFNHRWGKGKKDSPTTLPNGAKITFLTVGGRTSCVVPSVQKKTGAVAGDLKKEEENGGDDAAGEKKTAPKKVAKSKKRKETVDQKLDKEEVEKEDEKETKPKSNTPAKRQKKATAKPDTTKKSNTITEVKEELKEEVKATTNGRRRSGRNSKA